MQPYRADIVQHGPERLAAIRTQPGVTDYIEKDGMAYWKGPETEADRYKAILTAPAPSAPAVNMQYSQAPQNNVQPPYMPQPAAQRAVQQQPVPQQPVQQPIPQQSQPGYYPVQQRPVQQQPQPSYYPAPQQAAPSYYPQPVVRQQEPEPTGSWKPWAGLTAGVSAGTSVGFEIAGTIGRGLMETTPSSFNPDPHWYLVNGPIYGGVICGVLLGIIGASLGMSAYNDERQRQGLRRIGPF